MALYKNVTITYEFLDYNPNAYFIFGDNLERVGYGGAAALRDHPHAIGFITKKSPNNNDHSFYRPEEYIPIFNEELKKLVKIVASKPDKIFYISQLGAGLANRYKIWEKVIKNNILKTFESFENVIFCWNE